MKNIIYIRSNDDNFNKDKMKLKVQFNLNQIYSKLNTQGNTNTHYWKKNGQIRYKTFNWKYFNMRTREQNYQIYEREFSARRIHIIILWIVRYAY